MTKTTEKENEILEENIPEEESKPYTFRRLSSPDIFPMFKIIGKIGLKEFTAAIDKDVLKELIAGFYNGDSEESFAVNGASVIMSIADVIISKLPSCENDIYQILSQTSNLSVEEVKNLDMAAFVGMIIDFIKKEEFKDFIKVVSKLFK